MFNIGDKLTAKDIVLHIDNNVVSNDNLIHNEYSLVQQGNPLSLLPQKIINKLKDSLVGFDRTGRLVPDPTLSVQNKLGLLNKPLQSVFVNRVNAIEVFVKTLNNLLIKYPVLLTKDTQLLYSEEAKPLVFDSQVNSFTELSYLDTTDFANGYTILIPVDSRFSGKWTLYKFNGGTREFDLDRINVSTDLQETIAPSDILIIATPSAFLNELFMHITDWG